MQASTVNDNKDIAREEAARSRRESKKYAKYTSNIENNRQEKEHENPTKDIN